jgi:glutaredoxin-like protein
MVMEELAGLSDKLSVQVYNFAIDRDKAKEHRIDKIPGTLIAGEKDYGIRFYGIPSGYEFAALLDDILMVSSRDSGLSEESREKLVGLKSPLHIQVFVTPTWPYCPAAVRLAHQLAMESDLVTADMVEAVEFPHLSQRYGVRGVPKTIVNEMTAAEGMLPEEVFLDIVLAAGGALES